jgi:hypothetical protein
MAKRILTAALALTAALMASTAQAGVIDYDMSPVCQAFLPKCQAQCKAPADFIFVCSAGSGPNGGPLVKCDCLQPAQPAGGNQSEQGAAAPRPAAAAAAAAQAAPGRLLPPPPRPCAAAPRLTPPRAVLQGLC